MPIEVILGIFLHDHLYMDTIWQVCSEQLGIEEMVWTCMQNWFSYKSTVEKEASLYKVQQITPNKIRAKQNENDLKNLRLSFNDLKQIIPQ